MGKRVLTGVKPNNDIHIGNYLGAMKPAIALSKNPEVQAALFIADYHAMTSVPKAEELREWSYALAASWIACGLDPERHLIYRQSDVPEIFELTWILSCFTPKGLMNRAHAYKAKVQANEEVGKSDLDFGVNMGLYTYPILMAADILIYSADEVPVGEDQIQHVEIARDIAQKVNNTYGEILKMPNFVVQKVKLVPGLDGRKMSKSYNNIIPLFAPEKKLRKLVMKIVSDSSPPEAPKDPDQSLIFDVYKLFASESEVKEMADHYRRGISWGEAKQLTFEKINQEIQPYREKYESLMADKPQIDKYLARGAEGVRVEARSLLDRLRRAMGVGARS